jgi:lysophospholipase L1-like esterase
MKNISYYLNLIKKQSSKSRQNRFFLFQYYQQTTLKKNVIQKFNTLLGNWATTNNQITFVDSYQQFLNENGVISYDLTRDGIHLNDYGYIILTNQVKSKGKWN